MGEFITINKKNAEESEAWQSKGPFCLTLLTQQRIHVCGTSVQKCPPCFVVLDELTCVFIFTLYFEGPSVSFWIPAMGMGHEKLCASTLSHHSSLFLPKFLFQFPNHSSHFMVKCSLFKLYSMKSSKDKTEWGLELLFINI